SSSTEEQAGHPIDHLIATAQKRFDAILKNQATSLHDAASQYRAKRHRHPPPGFAEWYDFAAEKGAVVVEDFFDQIYADLGPFWGLDPRVLRQDVGAYSTKISIRNGVVAAKTRSAHPRLDVWTQMLQTLARKVKLPDVDIPVSYEDEPRIIAAWDTVDTALTFARPMLSSADRVVQEFSGLADVDENNATFAFDPEWLGARLRHPASALGPRPMWSLVKPGCAPGSPAEKSGVYSDILHKEGHTSEQHLAAALLPVEMPDNTSHGYAKNWTLATGACQFPNLQGLHGAFVAPESMSVSQKLFPLFGAAKMSMSNDILIPSAEDWNTSSSNDADPTLWSDRANRLVFRASAPASIRWRHSHLYRFASMLNASHVEIAEANLHAGNESSVGVGYARNFRLLPVNEYHLQTQTGGRLAEWVNGWAAGRLSDIECAEVEGCRELGKYFTVTDSSSPDPSPDSVRYKYTASLDARRSTFLEHLQSGTVTLKASVYLNWYDGRLVPWVHFVPLDNTFVDLYGVMEYFLGSAANYAHDAQAEKIAQAGHDWAAKALRKDDMLVYVYRLLLEYARVVDDKRERLGWVQDLLED
ncbi:hypothetical protein BDV95DRAFT_445673, partial [Massariosphaeria phaeospora]